VLDEGLDALRRILISSGLGRVLGARINSRRAWLFGSGSNDGQYAVYIYIYIYQSSRNTNTGRRRTQRRKSVTKSDVNHAAKLRRNTQTAHYNRQHLATGSRARL
jgi:hypothetical protein